MPPVPGRHKSLLLELDLTTALLETAPNDPLGKLRNRHRPRLLALLRTLHEAGTDNAVRGLIIKLGGGPMPWATMQELRDGVMEFVASGKPAVAWAETLGEGGNGTVGYVLATAFGTIWLQSSGELGLLGVAAETTFVRNTLTKIGIEPQLSKRHEYKNAADRIMRTEFTPEHHEAVDRLAATTWDGAVAAIAGARQLPEARVRELADRAPLTAEDAKSAGLIDRIGYRDEVYADLRARLGADVELLFADRWTPRRPSPLAWRPHRPVVALVEARGEIVSGRSRRGIVGAQVGSDTVTAALRAARDDDAVRAVLFRIDSPGGSAVASDTIWREVLLTREAGKPVVVSMAALAGSGGYYIACPANIIVAQPATLTGSIGVFGGKFVVSDLLERVGVTTGSVAHGARARMFSTRQGFTPQEQVELDVMLDAVYAQFISKVATGRGMAVAAVDAVARGRVWAGIDAAANGLVDTLGGFRDAARIARSLAELPADAPVRPARRASPLTRLRRPRSSEDPRAAQTVASGWDGLAGLGAAVGLPRAGLLRMPDIQLR